MNLEGFLRKGKEAKSFIKRSLVAGLVVSGLLFASCNVNPPPEPPTTETKTGVTNSEGQVTFTDNSTSEQVVLNVTDSQKLPLRNIRITYWDGNDFEVFLVDDPSEKYLPSLGIYPHNSEHTIETGRVGDGFYKIVTLDEDSSLGKVVWSWKDKTGINFSTYNYYKTVDYDEYLEIKDRNAEVLDLVWKGIEMFTGVSLPNKPSEVISHLFPERENPPQRWDVYAYNDGYDQSALLTMIPSNIPTVTIDDPKIEGSEIDFSWQGSDKDTYDQFTFLPDNRDLTKYLDGNTTSDLNYSYEITKGESVYGDYFWTSYSSRTSAAVNVSDSGNYSLEVRVKDEVGNIGKSSKSFSIASPLVRHTLSIQPGPESMKDASISRIVTNGESTYTGIGEGTSIEVYYQREGTTFSDRRALLQFPLSSIPKGSTIESAQIDLYGSSYAPNPYSPLIHFFKLNSSWDESTISWDAGLNSQYLTNTDIFVTQNTEYWHRFHIPATLVQDWIDNNNYGIELSAFNQCRFTFFTSDYMIDPSLRPKLEVTYLFSGP